MSSRYLLLPCLSVLFACSSTVNVRVPPRMSLDREQAVGVLVFTSDGVDDDHNVTGKFLQAVHEEQPGVPLLELGAQDQVLAELGEESLSAAAVQKIGEKYDVSMVLVGDQRLQESKPKVDVDVSRGLDLAAVRAEVRLDGTLEVKLMETDRGATVWTGSSSRWINLASGGGSALGGSLSLPDRQRQYEKLVYDMVREASVDYRSTWERRPKP